MRKVPILTFHTLADERSAIAFAPDRFRSDLRHLANRGYRSLDLLELVSLLRQGLPVPERSLVITFDDGYESVYTRALPVLREYDMTATIFVTAGNRPATRDSRLPDLEGRRMLRWSQLRELVEAGFSIGGHTVTHPDLTRLSTERIESEMREGKARLEDALDVAVTSFAYPFGSFDERCRERAAEFFACACSDQLGFAEAGSDLYALPRIETYYLNRGSRLGRLDSVRIHGLLVARKAPRRLRRLLRRWRAGSRP